MCVAMNGSFTWEMTNCSQARPVVCEMSLPVGVALHPGETLAREIPAAPAPVPTAPLPPPLPSLDPSTFCPDGFQLVPGSSSCLALRPLPAGAAAWPAAQHECSKDNATRLAPLTTAAHAVFAAELLGDLQCSTLNTTAGHSLTLSALIAVGDWGQEGRYAALDGRPVDVYDLGLHFDDELQSDGHDCVVLQSFHGGRQVQLQAVGCPDSGAVYAVCEALPHISGTPATLLAEGHIFEYF